MIKTKYFFVMAIVIGYLTGVGLEVIAEGPDAKLSKFAQSTPINLKFIQLPTFLKSAELSGTSSPIIEQANVSWEIIPVEQTKPDGKKHFVNAPLCIFHSSESVEHSTCVVCVFNPREDQVTWENFGLAQGRIELPDGYMASDSLPIPTEEPDPLTDPIPVEWVSSVLIGLCKVDGQGCTPGFWKTHSILGPATPDSWPVSVNEGDDFETLFGLTPGSLWLPPTNGPNAIVTPSLRTNRSLSG